MKQLLITTLCVLFAGTTAFAYPTQVVYTDGPQDPLFVPPNVHELGTSPGFDNYPDELIFATDTLTNETVCFDPTTPDDPAVPNTLVSMRNLTGIAWKDVWYVADPETSHSNYDGWVGDTPGALMGTAFRIDDKLNNPFDIHTPLVFESMTLDGIFEPLETWNFVIQDYVNSLGLLASHLGSIGVPSYNTAGINDLSSGSIIAAPVPEPATMCLLGLGALTVIRRRRSAVTKN